MFHDAICLLPGGGDTLPMMANREEQMAHQGWDAGYAEGYVAGLEEAWARVGALIERGPLPRDQSERRNALLLACRVIARPKLADSARRFEH
jgi:hypothetical protein